MLIFFEQERYLLLKVEFLYKIYQLLFLVDENYGIPNN